MFRLKSTIGPEEEEEEEEEEEININDEPSKNRNFNLFEQRSETFEPTVENQF